MKLNWTGFYKLPDWTWTGQSGLYNIIESAGKDGFSIFIKFQHLYTKFVRMFSKKNLFIDFWVKC